MSIVRAIGLLLFVVTVIPILAPVVLILGTYDWIDRAFAAILRMFEDK